MQIDILGCLALRGKLSKSMLRSILGHRRFADILYACSKLEDKGLIKKDGSKFGRGRRQYFYKITESGVALLIRIEPYDPLKFWKVMFGYCHHSNKKMSHESVDQLYRLFIARFLKFPNHGFFFQLDVFDNMRIDWLEKMILNYDKIGIPQKVLEVLAINPKISLQELVIRIREPETRVKTILSIYTLESYIPTINENEYYTDQNVIGKKYNKRYWDFMLHNTITIRRDSNGMKTYELSLFGVILVLTILRLQNMNKSKPDMYYKELNFPRYIEKIAINYRNKLPLIFGKWRLLRQILTVFAIYNFDIILDKELRSRDSKLSILSGGNKELFDGVQEIILQTRQQLGHLANTGDVLRANYISGLQYTYEGTKNYHDDYVISNELNIQDVRDFQRVYPITRKLDQLLTLLNPLEYIFSESTNVNPQSMKRLVEIMEEQFADEITALYYINLHYDYSFSNIISTPIPEMHLSPSFVSKVSLLRPKTCLFSILKKDVEVPLLSEWFTQWKHDIIALQKEICGYLK